MSQFLKPSPCNSRTGLANPDGPLVAVVAAEGVRLQGWRQAVDTSSMFEIALEELRGNDDWLRVLTAYQAIGEQAKSQDPEHDGWVPRVSEIEGLEEHHLPRIHGKLIALGMLKFQLAGRTAGVAYQISRDGLKAIDPNVPREPLAESA